MFKVIVERPRRGGSWAREARLFWCSEDAPAKMGMQRGHRRRKRLNENLAPLRRFLVRQVGRPWDSVYSEVCAVIDHRSTVKQHVLRHVPDLVAIETKLLDGKICGPSWNSPFTPLRDLPQQLYVHPESRLLCRNEERITWRQERLAEERRKEAEIHARRRIVSPTEQLHRVDGSWYFVRLAPLPDVRKEVRVVNGRRRELFVYDKRWDVLRKTLVSSRDRTTSHELYGRHGLYAAAKRQLGRQELRRYGLKCNP